MEQFLQLKGLQASQEKQMEALKDVIIGIAKDNANDFSDGELLLDGVGLLKYVANPPKLAFTATGKALNEVETIGLVKDLGEKYAKSAINMARLKIAVTQQDREAMSVLLNYGVELVLSQRLDVKAV
ncbi:hypothetical protein GCM10027190_39300 [Spirosoma areae]